MSDEYVAAFWEGEGCVGIYYRLGLRFPIVRIAIGQKNPMILYAIQDYLGYGRIYAKATIGSHELVIGRMDDRRDFIRRIYPYCHGPKKPKLKEAYHLMHRRRHG